MNSPAPGWHPDPSGRHEHRYWDGGRWTEHVADAGAQATDPLDAGGAAAGTAQGGGVPTGGSPTARTDATPTARTGPPGDEPTWLTDPTEPAPGDQPTQVDPTPGGHTRGYPPHDESTQEYPVQPGAAPPPPAAARRGLSPALIVAIAVVVVALVGGIAFLLTSDGDDDTTDVADRDPAEAGEPLDEPPEGGGDAGGTGGAGSDVTLPGDLGQEIGSEGELIDLMAEGITQESGGAVSREEAVCMSEVIVDRLGFEKLAEMARSGPTSNPLEGLTPEEQGDMIGDLVECAPDAMTEGFGG